MYLHAQCTHVILCGIINPFHIFFTLHAPIMSNASYFKFTNDFHHICTHDTLLKNLHFKMEI